MKYEYLKGSEKDFEGFAANVLTVYRVIGHIESHGSLLPSIYGNTPTYRTHNTEIIAERRAITDEADLNECIGQADTEDPFHISGQPPVKMCHESSTDWAIRTIAWAEKCKEEAKKELEQPNDEFIDDFVTFGRYDRQCKGVVIDVYDVLQAFEVVNPALQHLIKKALCAGLRGHKKREQDLVEILESAKRAIELEGGK